MSKLKIGVILGSIREGRAGAHVADWFMKITKDYDQVEFDFLDLKEFNMPLFADAILPSMRQSSDHNLPAVDRWLKRLDALEGFIIITPEYNHGYSSATKNALDYASREWTHKPVGFVGYGGFAGGARAVEQLRQVAAELRMYDVRDQVLIPTIWSAFDEAGQLKDNELHVKNAKLVIENVVELITKFRVD